MENAVMTCPEELRPDDQAVFERVWKRVMPEAREDCPIVVETTIVGGDLPCSCACSEEQTAQEQVQLPAPAPQPAPVHQGSDFPGAEDVPQLGRASAVYGQQLQRQVMDALECWQMYRHLARRAGNSGAARMLSVLASEKHRAARRLAAAYFLISGIRYWPVDRLSTPHIPSLNGTVRRGFQQEQQREQAYRLAAADTGDEALVELYNELADQSQDHSRTLRTILEQTSF